MPRPAALLPLLLLTALFVAPQASAQALPWPAFTPEDQDSRLALQPSALKPSARDSQLLPVVSDGRLEALLLLDAPPVAVNPLDRLLAPRTSSFGAAARVRVDGDNSVAAALRLDDGPAAMALLCNERIGLAVTLATLSEHCLLAPLSAAEHDGFLGQARARQLQAGWRNERLGVDLSFGLSWLDTGRPLPGTDAALGVLPTLAPLPGTGPLDFAAPHLAGARLLSQGIGVRGLFDLGSQRWLSLGSSYASNRLEGVLPGQDATGSWDSSTLSIGLGQGNLYGELTGHVSELPGSSALWGGLDLGISWRMPWHAELTFGARNLLSRGSNPWQLDEGKPADESESRIPYVRYHQDL